MRVYTVLKTIIQAIIIVKCLLNPINKTKLNKGLYKLIIIVVLELLKEKEVNQLINLIEVQLNL
jgi:hypothetical protein